MSSSSCSEIEEKRVTSIFHEDDFSTQQQVSKVHTNPNLFSSFVISMYCSSMIFFAFLNFSFTLILCHVLGL